MVKKRAKAGVFHGETKRALKGAFVLVAGTWRQDSNR
jgi:hypothetical protein